MHPETFGAVGDAVFDIVVVTGLEVLKPGAETLQSLGALVERDGPLVDGLAVQAVQEEGLLAGLDGADASGFAVLEPVLHAEHKPLDPRRDARDPPGESKEVVVDVVAQPAVVVASRRLTELDGAGLQVDRVDDVGGPNSGAAHVGEPPDTHKLVLAPEVLLPPLKDALI